MFYILSLTFVALPYAQTAVFFYRWWSLPVSALNLAVPLTVSPDMTINEVLELLSNEGYDQVPVIDDTG